MAKTLVTPSRLIVGGGDLTGITKELSVETTRELQDTTVLDKSARTWQSALTMATISASGFMPTADLDDHWLWAYNAVKKGRPLSTDVTWGKGGDRWAIYLPEGLVAATSAKAGAHVEAHRIDGSSFQHGKAVGEVASYALSLSTSKEVLDAGEVVASIPDTHSGSVSKAFTPTANRAYLEGFRKLWIIGFLQGAAAPSAGIGIQIQDAQSSVTNTQIAKVVVGNPLTVIKFNDDLISATSAVDIQVGSGEVNKIPVGGTLWLMAAFGKD